MQIEINNTIYDVVITKKVGTKNTYFRVKNDLKLYVSTNAFVTDKQIKKMITENIDSISSMFLKQQKKINNNTGFYYLGKQYDVVNVLGSDITLGENKVFVGRDANIEKWYQKQAKKLFRERLDYWYSVFTREIPYPSLTIRKMTSRWGVCNSKLKRVTLNLELMKRNIDCLDYVIVHELSHFKEMNHSSKFWKVVEENYPNYKKIRRIMKDY